MKESDECLSELLSLTMCPGSCVIVYRNSLGQIHRVHGPAVIWDDGSRFWYQDGNLHRTSGPAIEWPSGETRWYLHGDEIYE